MTNAISNPQTAPDTSASATRGLPSNQEISKQQFLTLFIEQLKNQDPLSPLDPSQLTAQLAQFSSLEQLTGINTRLDTLADATKHSTNSTLLSLLGKRVAVEGGRLGLKDGKASEVQYALDQAAERVTATVRDSTGTVVRVVELGSQAAGVQSFTFDGKSRLGLTLADGEYRVEIGATAAGEDKATPVPVTTLATVDGADLGADPPVLIVGGARVPLEDVREVHAEAPAA